MKIHFIKKSYNGPVILWGMYFHRGNEIESLIDALQEIINEKQVTIIAFEVDDWNREFSPWATNVLDESFSGEAQRTLDYIIKEIISQYSNRDIYIMGYSLAGLFALWALSKTDIFKGAASCSGSLWYPGFVTYIKKQTHVKNKNIYISLGGKESKTKNRLMSGIGNCTDELVKFLKNDNNIKYEMNPGGHFADASKRLAKAVKWILEQII